MGIVVTIILYVFGILILGAVLESAIRKGINTSIIGRFLEERYGIKEDKNNASFPDDAENHQTKE
ncbi:hypothetical protein SAMN05192534_13820 [Alteribacillus persepolensis]|uniref:Uncharacterized protein n=1 Tax=Alteribacillus persepolensis TaxID=568899 RepID=A0A1G8JXH0_9BACI|nr:hypothetical protein [Alteribacillus persepolensis]SDI35858.1 hypothetical protein SAMN05192534_13820 [Alteribacillus persepolensis]